MHIKKIILNNFRIYKGVNSIEFPTDKIKNIHIISGYNGFGKTTFLTSLVWCLYGKNMQTVDRIFKDKISSAGGYIAYLQDCLNISAAVQGEQEYEVTILLDDINVPGVIVNEVEIKRRYENGEEILSILIDGTENELVNDVGNEVFIQDFILPKEIAKFFFFDAEKITSIAEIKSIEDKRQLSKAYSEVLGIKKYTDLKDNLFNLRLRFKKQSATTQDRTKLNMLEQEINKLEYEIENLQETIEDNETVLERYKKKINQLQEKLIRQGSSMTLSQLQKLHIQKKDYENKAKYLKDHFKQLLDLAPFAMLIDTINNLETQLNKEKLQDTDQKIRTEFQEKAKKILYSFKSKKSYVPKEIHQEYYQKLKAVIENHLGVKEDYVNEDIKILHNFSNDEYHKTLAIQSQLKSSYREGIKTLYSSIRKNRTDLQNVRNKLSKAESKEHDVVIQKVRDEKLDVEIKIVNLSQENLKISEGIGLKKRSTPN